MNTQWRLTDNTHHRTFVEVLDPQFLPCLSHVGWSRFLHADEPITQHVHAGSVEFCYVSRGNPVFSIGNKDFPMNPNHLFITHPTDTHGTGEKPVDKMDLYWIGIPVSDDHSTFLGMDRYPETAILHRQIMSLDKHVYTASPTLGEYISRILSLFVTNDPLLRPMASSIVLLFLSEVLKSAFSGESIDISPLMRTCVTYIDRHVGEVLSLDALAESCNLTASHFKHRFRKEIGIPPGEYILRKKVQRATELLRGTNKRIIDIAYDLGFSSSQYFATVYRRFTGTTPSQVRRYV